jgi:hypothetical protein
MKSDLAQGAFRPGRLMTVPGLETRTLDFRLTYGGRRN